MREWESYEKVAQFLVNQFADKFGLVGVEDKQKIKGHYTGTEWEIDAKGVCRNGIGFIVIECRRYTKSKLSQSKIGELAYIIFDTGAVGGILVSPLGFQEGAKKIASSNNVLEVRLTPNSTYYEYFLEFLNQVMIGVKEQVYVRDGVTVTKAE